MNFKGVPLQDLLLVLLQYISIRDLAQFCLLSKELKQSFFDSNAFWLKIAATLYPSTGWAHLSLDNGEVRQVLIDMKSKDDTDYLESFFMWKYLMTRLAAPPASPIHLKFYIRIDTTEMTTPTLLVGILFEERVQPKVKSTDMYARDSDGKLKIGKLKEDRYKLEHSDDPFFRADRHTNNNGLLDSYEDLSSSSEKKEAEKKKKPRVRRMFPIHFSFRFQRLDGKPFAIWRRLKFHDRIESYFDRKSSKILYALDRSVKGPLVVKDIKDILNVQIYQDLDARVEDAALLGSFAKPGKSLFDSISAMKPFVTLYSYVSTVVSVKKLFKIYGPK